MILKSLKERQLNSKSKTIQTRLPTKKTIWNSKLRMETVTNSGRQWVMITQKVLLWANPIKLLQRHLNLHIRKNMSNFQTILKNEKTKNL